MRPVNVNDERPELRQWAEFKPGFVPPGWTRGMALIVHRPKAFECGLVFLNYIDRGVRKRFPDGRSGAFYYAHNQIEAVEEWLKWWNE